MVATRRNREDSISNSDLLPIDKMNDEDSNEDQGTYKRRRRKSSRSESVINQYYD